MAKLEISITLIDHNGVHLPMVQVIEAPKRKFTTWCKFTFELKIFGNSVKTINPETEVVTISVKERWYHRLENWVYYKLKKPVAYMGKSYGIKDFVNFKINGKGPN